MLKYFFTSLARSELLAILAAIATAASLIVEMILASKFEAVRLIPIIIAISYVIAHLWKTWKFTSQTYSAIPLPYFICLGQSHEWYISAIKQQESHIKKLGIAWPEIQNTFKIHRQDWAFFDSSKLNDESTNWIHKTKDVSNHFDHLANRIECQPLFHVFVAAPAPIALGVGALFAGRGPFSLHQHAGMVQSPYVPVHESERIISPEDGYHILNRQLASFKHIEIKSGDDDSNIEVDEAIIVLDFTGHRLPKPYPSKNSSRVIRLGMVGEEGNISLKKPWIEIAQEICSIVSKELNTGKKVSILLGVPSGLAFLMGTILRTSSRLEVYYFNRSIDNYHRVFNLSELD